MANVKISEMTAATSVADADLIPIVQGGVNKKATASLLPVGYPAGTKMYTALLTQTGTDAPVATPLQNTLGGTVVWSYASSGVYNGTLSAAFSSGKTWLMLQNQTWLDNLEVSFNRVDSNVVRLETSNNGVLTADAPAYIQIIVFP